MSLPLPGMETVAEARERLMEERWEGTRCPCCGQKAKVYPRIIHAGMAQQLVKAWRAVHDEPGQWFHMGRTVGRGGDPAKARYWGLIEEETDVRRDDGGRAGWWRFTPLGARWVVGLATVTKYRHVYDEQLLRSDGPQWSVHQALGKKFNLRELLGFAPTEEDQS